MTDKMRNIVESGLWKVYKWQALLNRVNVLNM